MGALPPVFIEFLGKKTGFSLTAKGVKTELAEVAEQGGGSMKRLGAVSSAALLGIGVAAAVVAVKTVHMAADFQTQMTRVRTGAGELQKNMGMVSSGVLHMAGEVGQSTKELTSGLYMVESAGYHGADALNVLKVSAEGAKVGAADMASVTDATTTALNAYKLGAGSVTNVMNALVATEASGKTNMEALAGSMSSILPVAAAAHVGLYEVLGAMATMTSQGTSAKVAATYLRQTIGQLSNPTQKAASEMKDLGLNAVDVATTLGKKGLVAALDMLTDGIQKHMGPAGTVLIDKLKSVSSNATAFQKVLANLPPEQQTYIGALATMVGGTKSMMAALQLTGPHMATFQANVKTIGDHVKDGGKEVEGWSDVQATFNQRMAEAKDSMGALGIEIGTDLLPAAMSFMNVIAKTANFLNQHHTALELFAAGLVAVALGLSVAKVASWDFNASLLADPLVWIVVGIVALVAGLVLLVMHWKEVAHWLDVGWGITVKALGVAWHWLADVTKTVWEDGIKKPIVESWNWIVSISKAGYHGTVDPMVSAWHWVAGITTTVWGAISGFFMKWWPLLIIIFALPIALLMGTWNHFHTQITAVVVATWNFVWGFLKLIWSVIVVAAMVQWAAIKMAVINPMISAWGQLKSIWNTVAKWLSAAWSGISNTAASWWRAVWHAISGPLNSAWGDVKRLGTNMKNEFVRQMKETVSAVSGIAGWFYSIGADIVHGVVKGIKDNAGQVGDQLQGMAEDALSAAKSFLGINSPSKLFAKHVGAALPEGVAKGVKDNAHLAVSAVRSMVAGLPLDSSPFGAGGSSIPSGSGGNVTHNHVHVTVQGTVVAENDLADVFQKVMLQQGARNSRTYPAFKR